MLSRRVRTSGIPPADARSAFPGRVDDYALVPRVGGEKCDGGKSAKMIYAAGEIARYRPTNRCPLDTRKITLLPILFARGGRNVFDNKHFFRITITRTLLKRPSSRPCASSHAENRCDKHCVFDEHVRLDMSRYRGEGTLPTRL